MRKLLFTKKGVSLAELVVCVVVLALVASSLMMVAHNVNDNYNKVELQWSIQQEIKYVMDSLQRDSASGSLSTATSVDLFHDDFVGEDGGKELKSCRKDVQVTNESGTVETKTFGKFTESTNPEDPENTLIFEYGDPTSIYFFNYNNLFYVLNRGQTKAVPFKLFEEIKFTTEFSIATSASEISPTVGTTEGSTEETTNAGPAQRYENEIKASGKNYLPNCLTVKITSDDEYSPCKYSMTSSYSLRNMREGQYINVTGNYYTSEYVAGWTSSLSSEENPVENPAKDGVYGTNKDSKAALDRFDKTGVTYDNKNEAANVVRYTSSSAYFGQVDAGDGSTQSQVSCGTRWLMMNHKFSEPVIDNLHDFRDNVLKGNVIGDFIIEKYYDWSPAVIKVAENNEFVEKCLRWFVIHFAMMLE